MQGSEGFGLGCAASIPEGEQGCLAPGAREAPIGDRILGERDCKAIVRELAPDPAGFSRMESGIVQSDRLPSGRAQEGRALTLQLCLVASSCKPRGGSITTGPIVSVSISWGLPPG